MYSKTSKSWGELIVVLIAMTFASSSHGQSTTASECTIRLGDDGKTNVLQGPGQYPTVGGAWTFIRSTSGPCKFTVFNNSNFQGNRFAVYGPNLTKRVRAGARGNDRTGGWKVRSVLISPAASTNCVATIGDGGISMDFLGPDDIDGISGWDFVRRLSGPCIFEFYRKRNFRNIIQQSTTNRIKRNREQWDIQSLRIIRQFADNTRACSITGVWHNMEPIDRQFWNILAVNSATNQEFSTRFNANKGYILNDLPEGEYQIRLITRGDFPRHPTLNQNTVWCVGRVVGIDISW